MSERDESCGLPGCTGFSCPYCGRCTAACPNMACVRTGEFVIGAVPLEGAGMYTGPDPEGYKADRETAWDCADDCDTCWFLLTDTAFEQYGDDVIAVKLRNHLASGHMTDSGES